MLTAAPGTFPTVRPRLWHSTRGILPTWRTRLRHHRIVLLQCRVVEGSPVPTAHGRVPIFHLSASTGTNTSAGDDFSPSPPVALRDVG